MKEKNHQHSGQTKNQSEVKQTGEVKKLSVVKSSTAVYDCCPHCGKELSPWEKVLLSVDHMIMCKNCWYRIVLDVIDQGKK